MEDVELNQYLARHIMESWGFEVAIAVNGAEALDLLEERAFDLILMDIQMPVMDGIEATRRIRQLPDPLKSSIPIVALTANTFKEDVELYYQVGMNDYLPKPFDEPRLFKIISKSLMNKNDACPPSHGGSSASTILSKPYDLSIVVAISGGDDEFVKRMVVMFVDTIPALLDELENSSERGNWDAVGRLAHRLKSTIDSMGIASLKTVIRSLEKFGKEESNIDKIPALVNDVRNELEVCIKHVKKDFALN